MKFNLIIPSAGKGKRFLNAGYNVNKAFIEILNKKMINHVIDKFENNTNVYVICSESEFYNYKKELNQNINIIPIKEHKLGPAWSIHAIKDFIKQDEPYFVAYNDITWDWNFERLIDYIQIENPDGIIFTHSGFHPHLFKNNYSAFCKCSDNKVVEIREKQSFTYDWMNEDLSIGVFYFKTGEIFNNSINHIIRNDTKTAEEFFPSVAFNKLISDNLKVLKYPVKNFIHWGIPEQFEDTIRWNKIFQTENPHNSLTTCLMMCGKGERMKTLFSENKSFIEIDKIPLYKFVLNKYNSSKSCCIVNNITIKNLDENINFYNIGEETSSQTESLKKAVKYLTTLQNTILSSNDCYALFDYSKLASVSNDADIVIFGFVPSLLQSKQENAHTSFSIDIEGNVKEIHFKKFVKNSYGFGGMIFFRDGKIFENLQNIDTNTFPSLDHYIGYLIENKNKVKYILCDYYVHLGTPEEFKEYLFWKDFFNNKKKGCQN
ncbi:MAG TPA: NTP transferase domain-containing protein [Bacteroidales bacterium]|nr:NTP transferase domain-containing protein [Bacteroidales bacterium]HOL98048.1 NTP transferase domain-containing protein [Bacteroidales bacterium]HOM37117.1 NTP transferase domain-containing protein [Bacteroidales bacterium]HPD23634.1 NTP transferase domain-containing protein [Bacteroidales bacterium]HRS99654.1 NTP transferase domain-containing protein [Bacteroidales bacterium]